MEHVLQPPAWPPRVPPRTGLDAWLRRQARRERRLVTLEDALLGNRDRAYAVYRLRFFFLRFACSAVLHVVRLGFLRFIFSHQAFLTTIVLNALAGLTGSFWWGALEVLRGRVRRLSREGQGRQIPNEIGQWLTIALCPAALSLLLPASWVTWKLVTSHHRFDVLHLYVIVIGLRLGLDLLTLTFHSGIYAIRRVYRPLPAIIAAEIAGFAGVVVLWPWLGRWSFPIAMFMSTILGTSFLVHYTARVYRLLGWLPLRCERPAFSHLVRWRNVNEFLAGGGSYALMKMDAFLMLAAFRAHADASHPVSLFMLFVSIAPAVQAGFDWAQLLYFDLKRLNARCVARLRQRYEQSARHLAWIVGTLLWGSACLLGTVIMGRGLGDLYWWIGPLFLSRSLLALAQVQAFSRRRYGLLLGSGLLLLIVLRTLDVAFPGERYELLGLSVTCFLAAWLLRVSPQTAEEEAAEGRVLPLAEWLACLSELREPVRVRSLGFVNDPEPLLRLNCRPREQRTDDRWRHQRLAQRMARWLRGHGAVAIVPPTQIIWYETAGGRPAISVTTLLRWGGGLVDALIGTALEPDGQAALRAARNAGVARDFFRRAWRPGGNTSISLAQVRDAFTRMVPRGLIYSPDDDRPVALSAASTKDRRSILSEAIYFARHLRGSLRRSRFDVTSFSVAGELKYIFIIDRECDHRQRLRWRRFITRANVAAAVARPSTADAPPHTAVLPRWRRNGRGTDHDACGAMSS